MTRTEFIKAYAARSGLSSEWAVIGLIDPGGRANRMIALPCACDAENCEGWGMVTIESVLHHLQFCAPEALRNAYMDALQDS